MIIPSEDRATMVAYRSGRSLEQFLDDMWGRRYPEPPIKSVAKWPMIVGTQPAKPALSDPANVAPVKVTKIRG